MKKLLGLIISLSALAILNCAEESSFIDPKSLVTITSGFSSSYMTFQITDGVATVPEYKMLNDTAGLTYDGTNSGGMFALTSATETHLVSIMLSAPSEGAAYLEGSSGLFSYTRNGTAYTIYADYTTGNDFRLEITKWDGPGKFMQATFSGIVCNGAGTADCLTIESGFINALIR
ncbi:MAG TPA: hypothetical protein PLM53_10740 [Spirochaetota bacterium]|nr:hypothetical protein [Spirochaetota bacterium]HPC39329.1 hypothetical protein [Spirochaetota bacterium]HPL15136.1 hypothetical protein [Spirochaetota bacterium]HQF08733.1 hypothetical protein [Spirochaetota bacterium]HQH97566.1 hypothetical protein [Spirochaetota bacterium]